MSISLSLRPTPEAQLLLIVLVVVAFLGLTACQGRPKSHPEVAPPAPVQEVKVAVPVPCKIEQVAEKPRPSKQARKGDDIHTLTKIALADRRVLLAENGELRAANTSPCPGAK
jgi:hypothetical protein